MTDAELITRFLSGQITAFNTLVKRWERPIYNFILRYVGNREETRDLSQQTFIRAYKSLKRLRDPEKFSTWLYQIALNSCRDAARSRSRRPLSLDALQENGVDDLPELATSPTHHPDAFAHAQNVRDLLNRALQSIPEEQRVVVIMKEYQGLKFTEIADALSVPLNTVKSRMYYGLSALKKIFDQWNLDEEMVRYES
ncbi:MAG: sigma-70 family RNA polymerase sigma factor [bacterium]|nr:sigma-70 family RNA polymerase sigma factor [bacterium]